MKTKPSIASFLALSLFFASCTGESGKEDFYTAESGRFLKGGTEIPYYIGTNMWFGPLLLSDTEAANPERLYAELDSLKALGITNLRVLVGADGPEGPSYKVEPVLQHEPGVYDEKVFVGLDRFLVELAKRDMTAVLFLTNAWEWSGGFGQYLEWTGDGKVHSTNDSWEDYRAGICKFMMSEKSKTLFANHVRTVVGRTNSITGKPYSEDPTIFSWQICNEPRCFNEAPEYKKAMKDWIHETAALIKSLDSNHMVSTGNEGAFGCEGDIQLYEEIHDCPNIDYLTIHIWPFNWSWVRKDALAETLPNAISNTDDYINSHIRLAEKLGKPVVLEEFGFPRDGFQFSKNATTTSRDKYYTHVFGILEESAKRGGAFAGINFWSWGGLAKQNPDHIYWKKGDDYCGDPAQEQQGLNCVYMTDTTVDIIRDFNSRLSGITSDNSGAKSSDVLISNLSSLEKDGKTLYGHQDDVFYGHSWKIDNTPKGGFIQSDIQATAGQFPAVLGMDLGGIEIGDTKNLDGIPFDMMRDAATWHYAQGGILTFSWHLRNPLTGGDSWDVSSDKVVEYVLKGEGRQTMNLWLERTADFLASIKGPDGKPAPVIFRPWHEHTGSWFWWGRNLCSIEDYISLWNLTYNYMTYQRGLDNIIWAYSPGGGNSEEVYMERYPGDDIIDILGLDIYQYVGPDGVEAANLNFINQTRDAMTYVSRLASEKGKVAAITETGFEGIPVKDWWTGTLAKALEGIPMSYVLTWRNAWDKPGHFYGPYPGQESAEDFVKFATNGNILLLSDWRDYND